MKNKIRSICFLIFIGIFLMGYFFVKDRSFSSMENRYLEQLPSLSIKSYFSGEFSKKFERYTADQIIGKDSFVKVNNAMNRSGNITFINGVYFGKNGRLIQQYMRDDDQINANLNYINEFAQRHNDIAITFLIVPNASDIYPDELPYLAQCDAQSAVIDQAKSILASQVLVVDPSDNLKKHREEAIYYKTDHHWTMRGAYYGYQTLCDALDLPVTEQGDYVIHTIETPFYGSLYSKAPTFSQEPDTIDVWENMQGRYHVNYVEEKKEEDSLFVWDNATIKDKYTVFLDGNHPLTVIKSNSNNSEKVLIIKDSYAHCMVPFLADQYNEIHMMDLRYYHSSIDEYIKDNDIDSVIFIHNVDFLTIDNNFLWLSE